MPNHCDACPFAACDGCAYQPVTETEPGCTCGGMAACLQCQDRDAAYANRETT